MDPLDTMTATDWRRCYERSQEYATKLLSGQVTARRREAELVDRLRRRETRVRELEAENQRLRDRVEKWERLQHLAAEPLRPEHRHDLARARRQLTQRLRKDRATLAGLLAHGEPAGVLGRAVARLERLEQTLPN